MVKPCSHSGAQESPPLRRHGQVPSLQTGGPFNVPERTVGPSVAWSPERCQSGYAGSKNGRRVERWHTRPLRAPDHVKGKTDGRLGKFEVALEHVKETRDHFKVSLLREDSGASRD